MHPEYLTTREVAELLRLKERKVYDLAAEGNIPCTRATGKLLFSKAGVELWLAQNSTGNDKASGPKATVIAGSHDPLLEWALRESQCATTAGTFRLSVTDLNIRQWYW